MTPLNYFIGISKVSSLISSPIIIISLSVLPSLFRENIIDITLVGQIATTFNRMP
jgi:hypothetical protein